MKSKLLSSACILGAILLMACADGRYQPSVLDSHFGKTVNSVSYAQIADKEAAAHPPAKSPRKMDGYAGVYTMDSYRQSFNVQQTQQPSVNINIGGGSGSSGSGTSGGR